MKLAWLVVVFVSGCYARAQPATGPSNPDETWEPAPSSDEPHVEQPRLDETQPAPAPDYSEQNAQFQQQQDAIYEQSQQQLQDYNNAILSEPVPGPETLAPSTE